MNKLTPAEQSDAGMRRVLQHAISEQLECFTLVGYTFDGQPFVIVHAASPKDTMALNSLSCSVMTSGLNNGPHD